MEGTGKWEIKIIEYKFPSNERIIVPIRISSSRFKLNSVQACSNEYLHRPSIIHLITAYHFFLPKSHIVLVSSYSGDSRTILQLKILNIYVCRI